MCIVSMEYLRSGYEVLEEYLRSGYGVPEEWVEST
jgi:hypothetical protein